MAMHYLGETFDLHGGGMDLKFPHHENEIAQSETATGKPFAKYWLHNGLTRVATKAAGGESEKMSKSLGNVRLIRDLLDQYGPETVRFFILSTHYRRPIEFNDEVMDNTVKSVGTFHRLFERVERVCGSSPYEADKRLDSVAGEATNDADRTFIRQALTVKLGFIERMDDDFNTAGAIALMHDLAGLINRYIDEQQLEVKARPDAQKFVLAATLMEIELGRLLGLFVRPPAKAKPDDALTGQLMELIIALRKEARESKNYALADRIRTGLDALGIKLEDRPDGTGWRKG
jgi:cysteinyl-tRNA synthetase